MREVREGEHGKQLHLSTLRNGTDMKWCECKQYGNDDHPDGSTNTFVSQTNKQNNQEIKAPLGRFSLQILGKNNEFLVNTQEDLPGLGARGQAVRRVHLGFTCVEFVLSIIISLKIMKIINFAPHLWSFWWFSWYIVRIRWCSAKTWPFRWLSRKLGQEAGCLDVF